ncbi:MAG: hypothetical protein WD871_04570, partial [Xanthobacteraceae bacterium]
EIQAEGKEASQAEEEIEAQGEKEKREEDEEKGKEEIERAAVVAPFQNVSWPGLSRPSTPFELPRSEDVDARDKPGHDDSWKSERSAQRCGMTGLAAFNSAMMG